MGLFRALYTSKLYISQEKKQSMIKTVIMQLTYSFVLSNSKIQIFQFMSWFLKFILQNI